MGEEAGPPGLSAMETSRSGVSRTSASRETTTAGETPLPEKVVCLSGQLGLQVGPTLCVRVPQQALRAHSGPRRTEDLMHYGLRKVEMCWGVLRLPDDPAPSSVPLSVPSDEPEQRLYHLRCWKCPHSQCKCLWEYRKSQARPVLKVSTTSDRGKVEPPGRAVTHSI